MWANAEAATFYARALEAASRLRSLPRGEVSAVAEALGDASELAGNYTRSRQAYAQARRLVDGEVDTGAVVAQDGRPAREARPLPSGPRVLHEGPPSHHERKQAAWSERSELDLASAGICSRQGRYLDCTRFAKEAARDATRAEHRSGLAHTLYLEHMMSVYLGNRRTVWPPGRSPSSRRSVTSSGSGNVLNNLGIGAYYKGNWVRSASTMRPAARRGNAQATSSEPRRKRTTSPRSFPIRAT